MNELKQIESVFGNPKAVVSKEQVDHWKQSVNIEVLGAVAELLLNKKLYKLIEPKPTVNDYYPFLYQFYTQCMKNDCEGEWCPSRYIAAYELRNFIEGIWNNKSNGIEKIKKNFKHRISDFCINADEDLKDVIINGLLEHLFENNEIKVFFFDWKKNVVLNEFFECALDKSRDIRKV